VIELKLEDWDGDLRKLSEQSQRRLLAQIEARIAGGDCDIEVLRPAFQKA